MPSQRRGSLRGSLRGSSFGESGSAAASSELKSCGGAAERGSARTAACGSGDSARPVGDACHQRAVPAAPAASASMPRIVPRGIFAPREGKRSGPLRGLGSLRRARTGSGLHEELDDGSQGLQHDGHERRRRSRALRRWAAAAWKERTATEGATRRTRCRTARRRSTWCSRRCSPTSGRRKSSSSSRRPSSRARTSSSTWCASMCARVAAPAPRPRAAVVAGDGPGRSVWACRPVGLLLWPWPQL